MRDWFYLLDTREQQIVRLGLFFLLLIGAYLLIIEPTEKLLEQANHRVAAKEAEYIQLQKLAREHSGLGLDNSITAQKLDRSLLSLIDKSSQDAGIKRAIKRLVPEGDKKVRVHFERAEFDRVIGWIVTNYQQQGISVEGLHFRNTNESGLVSGTAMLVR